MRMARFWAGSPATPLACCVPAEQAFHRGVANGKEPKHERLPSFEALNARTVEQGKTRFANPRNVPRSSRKAVIVTLAPFDVDERGQ